MKKIENYNNDFIELFIIEVNQINRTCKIIGVNKDKEFILKIFEKYSIGLNYSEICEFYLLTEEELRNYNIDILYETKEVSLLCYKDNLAFVKNNNVYSLSSYPYEPCLYIKCDNKTIITIHNSFTVSEIISIAKENKVLKSLSGNDYDIKEICHLFICAIDNNIFDTDISYLEKLLGLDSNKEDSKKIKNTDNKMSQRCLNNSRKNSKLIELTDDVFYKEYEKYPDCVLDYCIIKNNSTYNSIASHKEAIIFAMEKWKKCLKDDYDLDIVYNQQKIKGTKIDANLFFSNSLKDNSYCYLFLNPPYGNNYNINDFHKINNILFPNGFDNLEIYEWSTDWSNYFDDGLEWWGAKCVSIYDDTLNRFVVIGASATD